MKYLLIIPILISSISTNAEIITDGTLGQDINLSGPNFQITPDLGQQHGNNLFHSFQDFNLNSSESATFSGLNSIQNIISRVTGGNPSNIDGLIRSTIPNADFYFLNPYGIMFGENAKLDVQGSFHASTADYLRLGNNGRFDARNLNDSLLTVAPVEAFGFLSTSQAKLTINNSSLYTDKTLSIIGNNIDINQAQLTANHLNLISATGAVLLDDLTVVDKLGNINIQNSKFDSNTIELKANNISLQNGTIINASGDEANINLHAGDSILAIGENTDLIATALKIESGKNANITLTAKQISFQDGAYIFSKTSDNNDGSDITLNAKSVLFTGSGSQAAGFPTTIKSTTVSEQDDAGKSGDLMINAENITVKDNGYFYVTTDGAGQGGNMLFKADNFQLEDAVIIIDTTNNGNAGAIIFDITENIDAKAGSIYNFPIPPFIGNAGKIIINARNITLADGSYIISNSFGVGRAGDITVNAQETIKISGANAEAGWSSVIGSSSNVKMPNIVGGDAGNIIITANNLLLQDGGQVTSGSIAPKGMRSGKGGIINIDVRNIEITGVNQYGETEDGFSSGIYARSIGVEDNAGNGGKISLQADSLKITDGGVIVSSTNNYANSGEIEIIVKNDIKINGDSSTSKLQEPLPAQLRYLSDFSPKDYNQATSGIYANSKNDNVKAGRAGNIYVKANKLVLADNGEISSSIIGGGHAGNINIEVSKLKMDSSANISSASSLNNVFEQVISKGDIIKVADIGNNKSGRYVNNGNSLIKVSSPVYKVNNINELNKLVEQYDIISGQIVTVQDIGNGESARFIYTIYTPYNLAIWQKITDDITVVLNNTEELYSFSKTYNPGEKMPFANGQIIRVKDIGDGKSANFVFVSLTNLENGKYETNSLKINQFTFKNMAEMNGMTDSLQGYPTALVLDSGKEFIHIDDKWQALNNIYDVDNINAMDTLNLAQVGNIVKDKIYTGERWITLNNIERKSIANLAELDKIFAKEGDLIDVNDVNGQLEHFFYADGKWIQQVKGGDAGQVIITADNIQLSNSEISTESVSAGGGSIEINNNNLVFLNNGKITASVKEGKGNGGNLAISKPNFIILKNGQIIAQAFEGNGGNINLESEQLITSPTSLVSASSKLGLDGKVQIESPDMNLDGFLVILSDDVVEASSLMKKPCSMRGSSFTVQKINGSPQTPHDYQAARYLPEDKIVTTFKKSDKKSVLNTCKN